MALDLQVAGSCYSLYHTFTSVIHNLKIPFRTQVGDAGTERARSAYPYQARIVWMPSIGVLNVSQASCRCLHALLSRALGSWDRSSLRHCVDANERQWQRGRFLLARAFVLSPPGVQKMRRRMEALCSWKERIRYCPAMMTGCFRAAHLRPRKPLEDNDVRQWMDPLRLVGQALHVSFDDSRLSWLLDC